MNYRGRLRKVRPTAFFILIIHHSFAVRKTKKRNRMKPKNSFTIQDIALKTIMFNEKGVCPGNCYRGTEENPLTALPTGEHRILRHYCKQYQRYMPVILTAMSEEPRAMSQEKLTAHRSLLTARCEGCEPQKTEDKEVSINTPHLSS